MKEDMRKGEKRRRATIRKLVSKGIDFCQSLPLIGGERICKGEKEIGKRFLSSLYFSWRTCSYSADRQYYDTEAKEIVEDIVKIFGLSSWLFPDEERTLRDDCDEATIIRVSWETECCYALAWVLGLVSTEAMEDNASEADSSDFFKFTNPCHDFDDFEAACTMRSHSEIMDMLDLYYNYHWACVDHRINPEAKKGNLDEGIVMERRRALEWLISPERVWDDISLDT